MKRTTLLQLLLLCLSACGRVGFDLLPSEEDPLQLDATVQDPDTGIDQEDGTADIDSTLPVREDAAEPVAADAGEDRSAEAGSPEDEAGVDAGPPDASSPDGSAPDATVEDAGNDASVPAGLVLRYDFVGTGTTVQDRIGAAHGRIFGGAQLDGTGGLTLDGNDDFVDMPNGLVSGLSSVTIMAWFTWSGGPCWQRIFDFGSNDAGEGNVGNATSALSLTASSCPEAALTALFEYQSDLDFARGSPLPQGARSQVAVVIDGASSRMLLYANGAQQATTSVRFQLSQINDVNVWLGRSQWIQDVFARGRYEELRIYSRALSAAEIADANTRGPDVP